MNNSPRKTAITMQEVIRRVHRWLERDGASRIIVARETINELMKQDLPDHISVFPKKRQGQRKAVRKRRNYKDALFKLAVWPEDKMDENSLPSVCCVASGEVDLHIADYVLRCRAGDWIVLPAGVAKQDGTMAHFEGDTAGRAGDILWFTCWLGGINTWICRSHENLHFKPQNTACRVERHFLEKLFFGFCESAIAEDDDAEVVEQMLGLMLVMMQKEMQRENIMWTIGSRFYYDTHSNQQNPISRALEYIEDNLHQRLTINIVAREVLVSPATFTRRFREQTGKTFVEYQTERRLAIAERLLRTTNVPIGEICARVGLKYGRLRLLFQKKYNCSPSAYRDTKI